MAAKSKNDNEIDAAKYKDIFDRKPTGEYVNEYIYQVNPVRQTDLLDIAKAVRKESGSTGTKKE
jgi:hypothetical protein